MQGSLRMLRAMMPARVPRCKVSAPARLDRIPTSGHQSIRAAISFTYIVIAGALSLCTQPDTLRATPEPGDESDGVTQSKIGAACDLYRHSYTAFAEKGSQAL